MGGGKGGGSKAPSPSDTAQAQALANKEAVRESAIVGQIGIRSPYGRQFYTGKIGSPNRTLNIELTPGGERTRRAQERLGELLSGYGVSELGPAAMERLSAGPGEAADIFYERGARRLDPRYRRAEETLRSRLLGQGLSEGSRAYQQAMGEFGEREAEAFENLALGAQAQGFAEDRAQRSQAINELSALLQGAPALQMPVTQAPGQYQIAPPDIAGLTASRYAADASRANQQAAALGGLYGLAGTVAGGLLI